MPLHGVECICFHSIEISATLSVFIHMIVGNVMYVATQLPNTRFPSAMDNVAPHHVTFLEPARE